MKEFARSESIFKTWLWICKSLFSVSGSVFGLTRFRFSSFIYLFMPRSRQPLSILTKIDSLKLLFLLSWCHIFSTDQRARFFVFSAMLKTFFDGRHTWPWLWPRALCSFRPIAQRAHDYLNFSSDSQQFEWPNCCYSNFVEFLTWRKLSGYTFRTLWSCRKRRRRVVNIM